MFILGTLLLAVVTALACALPGVFVVLRKKSMVVDGIGHAVFPGIVIVAVVLALNLVGDALNDVLNPRLARKGRS